MVVPAFQGTSVPWVKAQPCRCTRCCTHPRCTTRWGIGLPVPAQTPPNSPKAGPAGHRRGATGGGFGLARPVDGPPETALGLRPRTVKRLDPEGDSNCGGADQTPPASAGGVSVPGQPPQHETTQAAGRREMVSQSIYL